MKSLRNEVIKYAKMLNSKKLSALRSGNISTRYKKGFLITPSGAKYSSLKSKDIVFVSLKGEFDEKKGIPVHVWVDETRPRNQGANLTSYELNEEGIANTIIADNTGGILMQRGDIDLCIVGTDRTLSTGDVCNKIGTYLKALAAYDNKVPFYVALPSSTIDWDIKNFKDIPIEERNPEELSHIEGLDENDNIKKVLIYPKNSKSLNLAFDITPAKYVTGLITEKGICEASNVALKKMFN